MSPEKQRIAIAEACGWKCPCGFKEAFACWVRPSAMEHQTEWLPDYLADLNAMHEAEKVLTKDQLIEQAEWIGACSNEMHIKAWVILLRATAAQRAKAFLRTVGKWEEDK